MVKKRKSKKKKIPNIDDIIDLVLAKLSATIDNMTFTELLEVLPMLLSMYYGAMSMKHINPLLGAGVGLTGYKLATSESEAGAIAGLVTLGGLGLTGLSFDIIRHQKEQIQAIQDDPNLTEDERFWRLAEYIQSGRVS